MQGLRDHARAYGWPIRSETGEHHIEGVGLPLPKLTPTPAVHLGDESSVVQAAEIAPRAPALDYVTGPLLLQVSDQATFRRT